MTDDISVRAACAKQQLKDGSNCAQAVLAAFEDDPRTPGITAAAGIGLGGGFAGSGALCGAVNAVGQVISAYVGTLHLPHKKDQAWAQKLLRQFMAGFKERYGAFDCTPILKNKPTFASRKEFCSDLVAYCVVEADRLISDRR
jgi:C_GCAxxG_C_C family probable redox protein